MDPTRVSRNRIYPVSLNHIVSALREEVVELCRPVVLVESKFLIGAGGLSDDYLQTKIKLGSLGP